MNPVAILHIIVALVIIGFSLPLMKRKIKMNPWYGIRIAESFKSEERWFEINQYGGRLMLWWGVVIGIMATIGLSFERRLWATYDFGALVIVLGGLGVVIALIFRYAARTKRA
jgi:uncharacterized membrane protein